MKIILISILLTASYFTFSQEARKKYADKQYENKMYHYAAEAYEDVLERTNDSLAITPNIARSYDKIKNLDKAVEWYSFMLRNDAIENQDLLQLALLKREQNDYAGFEETLQTYEKTFGPSEFSTKLLRENKTFDEIAEKDFDFETFNLNYDNSSPVISVCYIDSTQLIYSSSQRLVMPIKRIDGATGDFYYNLSIGEVDQNNSLQQKEELKIDNQKNKHLSSASIDRENDLIYFASNDLENQNGLVYIYRGNFLENEITNIEKLDFNGINYSCLNPSISSDGKTLYFSSNMAGGMGGLDIYSVQLDENGKSSKPVNLGKTINTPYDEIFPHILEKDNVLYFSSNGHLGYGGQDIFVAELRKNGEVKSIQNIGNKINSNRDDFSFINNEAQSEGYFISNRGNKDEIYGFHQNTIFETHSEISGVVTNEENEEVIPNTVIKLLDNNGNEVASTSSDEKGFYLFDLKGINADFKLAIEEFEKFNALQTTVVFDENKDLYEENLVLKPVEEEKDLVAELSIDPIFFDFNSSYLRRKSKKDLDKVVDYLNEYPVIKIELRAHADHRGKQKYNLWLTEKRAKSTYDYLISKGIDKDRISKKAFGHSQPAVPIEEISKSTSTKSKEKLHQQNRRTEFIVVTP